MKTVYFITDGVVERNRNWGSKIDWIIEDVLNERKYQIHSLYLSKDLENLIIPRSKVIHPTHMLYQ